MCLACFLGAAALAMAITDNPPMKHWLICRVKQLIIQP